MLSAGFRAACQASGCIERQPGHRRAERAAALRRLGAGGAHVLCPGAPRSGTTASRRPRRCCSGMPRPPGCPCRRCSGVQRRMGDHGQSRGYRVRGWDDDRIYTLHDQDYGAITIFDLTSRIGRFRDPGRGGGSSLRTSRAPAHCPPLGVERTGKASPLNGSGGWTGRWPPGGREEWVRQVDARARLRRGGARLRVRRLRARRRVRSGATHRPRGALDGEARARRARAVGLNSTWRPWHEIPPTAERSWSTSLATVRRLSSGACRCAPSCSPVCREGPGDHACGRVSAGEGVRALAPSTVYPAFRARGCRDGNGRRADAACPRLPHGAGSGYGLRGRGG